jgi:hypothetical protein
MHILTERKNVVIGVVVALVIGLLIGYGWGRQSAGGGVGVMMSTKVVATTTAPATSSKLIGSTKAPANTVVAEGNSVNVVGQAAGMSVAIRSVSLSEEGWVAIRDSSGATLGAALFAPGIHSDVSVPLLKPTQSGKNYQALIYFDDGTKTFDLNTETIVLNPDGSVAGATFNVQ